MEIRRPVSELPGARFLFYSPTLDRDLLLEFFMLFSRFEYALKRSGRYARAGRNDSAEPNWELFASDASGAWLSGQGPNSAAVRALVSAPPRRQVFRDGALGWADPPAASAESLTDVLRLVKTVRNNLFHGGKQPDGDIDEVSRNSTLLRASLLVLRTCVSLVPAVEEAFSD